MNAPDHYVTEVATAPPGATVREVADLMTHYAVGCVVLRDEERRPVGIVTDRDLALRVVARGLDPAATTAAEIATKPVHCVGTVDGLEQVIARMREAGVRRMPVVRDGALVGLVTLDDLVVQLGREVASLSAAATGAIDEGRRAGRKQRRRADLEESLAALEASALAAGREVIALVGRELDGLRERFRGESR